MKEKTEERKLIVPDQNLSDLPITAEEADETKGGGGFEKHLEVESFTWTASNPSR